MGVRRSAQTRGALADIGAAELPLTVVHGDFAEWNVHYERGRLAGVIDFGLTPVPRGSSHRTRQPRLPC